MKSGVSCPLIKGWLYLDKLRLSEAEELALLSSVNNQYDVRKLQHAALVQDRSFRRPAGAVGDKSSWNHGGGGKRWSRQTVHTTNHDDGEASSEEDEWPDEELVDKDTAVDHHSAYMAYQGTKAKCREVLKGRGVNQDEMKKLKSPRPLAQGPRMPSTRSEDWWPH